MQTYEPPFDDPSVTELAHRRGLISESESFRCGIARVTHVLTAADDALGALAGRGFGAQLGEALHAGRLAVSSQLMAGAGRSDHLAACTVLPTVGADDESRRRRTIAEVAVASEQGMGCGIDVSLFDDPARALHEINDAARQINDRLVGEGRRPPALMVTCEAKHARVTEFITAKQGADLSQWVANISVMLSATQREWDDLAPIIARCAHSNGEPGVLFKNVAEDDNPTPEVELTSTAPCAEVFLAEGERCVFMSVNLAAHVRGGRFDWGAFRNTVRVAVRAGDAAVTLAEQGAPSIVGERRRIGVGACGYHTALIDLQVPYSRSEAFARKVAEHLTFAAHSASAELAEARGAFPTWQTSRWRDRAWLRRKTHNRGGAIREDQWIELEENLLRHGIRHSAVVAFPPTGVVAELLGVSRSYEPHFSLAGQTGVASHREVRLAPEVRRALAGSACGEVLSEQILDPSTGHQVENAGPDHLLACARQLPAAVHLSVHAAFSLLADEAGSKTVNLPQATTVAEIQALLHEARGMNLKGLTVFRDGCLTEGNQS